MNSVLVADFGSIYVGKAVIPLRQAISDLERQVSELELFRTENSWVGPELAKLVKQHPQTLRALERFAAGHALIEGNMVTKGPLMEQVCNSLSIQDNPSNPSLRGRYLYSP
jgi:hypothetical protein